MTSPLPSRHPGDALAARLRALSEAVELADGRLPPEPVAEARALLDRAGTRVQLGPERTVVALAGSTGSGKSSLLNALSGASLSPVGVRRPTTGETHAAVWPGSDATALLSWLGVAHSGPPDASATTRDLTGLVLLDLPDSDSTVEANRVELERVVAVADVVAWVTDPQKYADRVLHERYLAEATPLAGSLVVLLNAVDRLDPSGRETVTGHLRRLLDDEGLDAVPLLTVSASTGEGLDAVRARLAETVSARRASLDRLAADVGVAAERLAWGLPPPLPPERLDPGTADLSAALQESVGVPALADAVADAHRQRALKAAGWPPLLLARRLKPDPLARVRMLLPGPTTPPPVSPDASAQPAITPNREADTVSRARVEAAVQALSRATGDGLPSAAAGRLRAAVPPVDELSHEMGLRVRETLETLDRPPRWTRWVGALQWLLLAAVVVGGGWLLARAALELLAVGTSLPLPTSGGLPVPTLLLLVGLVGGLLLSFVTARAAEVGAARRRRLADRRLTAAVESVADDHVLRPLRAELAGLQRLRAATAEARGE